jgi:uncharacterized protein involved in outer membrane biogenesis
MLLMAFWAATQLLTFNRYRAEMVSFLTPFFGGTPIIEGDIKISIFPAPAVTANRLQISYQESSTLPSTQINIRSLRCSFDLRNLWRRKINISQLFFDAPYLLIEEKKNSSPKKTDQQQQQWFEQIVTTAIKSDSALSFTKIDVKNGTVVVQEENDEWSIDDLNFRLVRSGKNSPLLLKGKNTLRGNSIEWDANIGTLDNTESAPVNIEIKSEQFSSQYQGIITQNENGLKSDGEIKISLKNLGRWTADFFTHNLLFSQIKSAESLDIKASLSLSHALLSLENINFLSENLDASGRLKIFLDHSAVWEFAMNAKRINIDALTKLPEAENKDTAWSGMISGRVGTSVSDLSFAISENLSALIHISAEDIIWHQKNIKNLNLEADIFASTLQVHAITATLPGEGELLVNARLTHNGIRPFLESRLQIEGKKFSDLLEWISEEKLPELPSALLASYSVNASFEGTPKTMAVKDITLAIDDILISGNIDMRPHDHFPLYMFKLHADRLNADRYKLPDWLKEKALNWAKEIAPRAVELSPLRQLEERFFVDLSIDDMLYNSQPLRDVSLIINISPGVFQIQEAKLRSPDGATNFSFLSNVNNTPPQFDLSLQSESLNLGLLASSQEKPATDAEKNWMEKPFNFLGIGEFKGNVKIAISKLVSESWNLDKINFAAQVADNVLNIQKCQFVLAGGNSQCQGGISLAPKASTARISYLFKDVDFQKAFADSTLFAGFDGIISLAGTIYFHGGSFAEWLKSSRADAQLRGSNIKISGIQLENIISSTPRLVSALDIENVVARSVNTGSTNFEIFASELEMRGNAIQLKNGQFSMGRARGTIASAIDLNNFQINSLMQIAFYADRENRVAFTLENKGFLNEATIEKNINTKTIEKYITGKATRQ